MVDTSEGIARPSKVLLIGSNARGSLENAYLRAISKAGFDVDVFDVTAGGLRLTGSHLVQRGINRLLLSPVSARLGGYRLLRFLENPRCNYDVAIVFKGAELPRKLLDRGRALLPSAVWVNLNPDDPLNTKSRGSTNDNIIASLDFFDLYCSWSTDVADKLALSGCRQVAVIPFGYDPDRHIPPASPVAIESGSVSFVGAWDMEREMVLTELRDFDLRIFGDGWNRVSRRSGLRGRCTPHNIYGEELALVMASTAVSLNLLRPQNHRSHNMRTFEIPAMGGLMLTTRTLEQERFFPEGSACLMYGGINELRENVKFAIENSDSVLRIRECGAHHVHRHSYVQRASELMAVVSKLVAQVS